MEPDRRHGWLELQVLTLKLLLPRAANRISVDIADRRRSTDPLLARGQELHRSGKLDEAEALYRQVLTSTPWSVDANAALGELLLQRKTYPAAIACFDQCVRVEPNNVEYLNNLGYAHILNGTDEFGLPHLLKAARLAPRNWRILANVGRAYTQLGRAEKGLPWLEKAVALAPRRKNKVRLMLGSVLVQVGEFDRAKAVFRELALKPWSAPAALRGLANVDKQSPTNNALAEIEQHLARTDLKEGQRLCLHQAAAKTHLDLGNVDEAFHHFLTVKRMEGLTFDIESFERVLATLRSLYTADYLASRDGEGDMENEPVFIIGMPRSGSTLLEQIISGHSQLVGMGERPYIATIARRLGHGTPGYVHMVRTMPRYVVGEIAKGYMSLARTAAERSGRTVDKFLHNFLHVGLIRLLFPRAKFLHARRNPMDCCFSMFTSPLTDGHAYTRDLATLGRYYRAYAQLMDYWSAEFPGLILDVDYEETVRDIEGTTRRVLDFLGLPWEENCLRFTENQRAVSTISRWQVRQPLYHTSIERWRPYEKHLQPLMRELGLLENDVPAPTAS